MLFNKIVGQRLSIVEDTPGVTRDRLYAESEWLGRKFNIVDTGGIEPSTDSEILSFMREQAQIAIDSATVTILVTDLRTGVTASDKEIANMLLKSRKPVVLAVNKADSVGPTDPAVYEFYELGIGDPIPISAANKQGIGDLLDQVTAGFEELSELDEDDEIPSIAIVGKPNVGKSSLINKLIGEERLIVSDIAGTTRDAVDTPVHFRGREYRFIDTAGLRRKSKVKEDLERYTVIRTVAAVDRADVVVLVIDAVEGITEQDAKIAGIAHDRGKGIVIAVNKWDAVKDKHSNSTKEYEEDVRRILSYLSYAEIVFISAQTGQRLNKLFATIDMVLENQKRRIATGVLNEIMTEAVALQSPPTDKGRRLKLYYITQVAVKPPTFVIFVNDRELMHFSYQRYIENQIRQSFAFKGTALRILIRERTEKEKK